MGPPADREECVRVLRRAVELGVNFIDTADSYGPYVSEEIIREALHPYAGLVIATKAGLLRTGPGCGFRWVTRAICARSAR
ncbi:aldo/keto reductase family protein [Mycobacterium kansasii]|uniref:Aldo/keto reductase family protein n=1 Tax=Mycobacterium kansasii TaxID=1768 RepID=A0A1V3WGF0_MYCKA|nr:aldo/keto reductase family protein [Mycobacterium kansasii]